MRFANCFRCGLFLMRSIVWSGKADAKLVCQTTSVYNFGWQTLFQPHTCVSTWFFFHQEVCCKPFFFKPGVCGKLSFLGTRNVWQLILFGTGNMWQPRSLQLVFYSEDVWQLSCFHFGLAQKRCGNFFSLGCRVWLCSSWKGFHLNNDQRQ